MQEKEFCINGAEKLTEEATPSANDEGVSCGKQKWQLPAKWSEVMRKAAELHTALTCCEQSEAARE